MNYKSNSQKENMLFAIKEMKEYHVFLLVSIWMNLVIHTSAGNVHILMMFPLLVNVTFLCDYIPDHLKVEMFIAAFYHIAKFNFTMKYYQY